MRNKFLKVGEGNPGEALERRQSGSVTTITLLGVLLVMVSGLAAWLLYDKLQAEGAAEAQPVMEPEPVVVYKAEPAPLEARLAAVQELFNEAQEALRAGDHQQALVQFNSAATVTAELLKSTQLGPNEGGIRQLLAAAHRGSGECHFEMAQYAKALREYQKVLEFAPEDELVQARLAQCLLAEDAPERARGHLQEVLTGQQPHIAALTAYGQYLVGEKNDLEMARRVLQTALKREPGLAEALFWLGRVEEKAGNPAAAREAFAAAAEGFSRALAQRPGALRWRSYRSVCYVRTGQYAEAVADLNAVLSSSSSETRSAVAYANRGFCMLQLGHSRQAIDDFTAALSQDPGMVSAYLNLGDALAFEQNYREAIENYTRALELDPENSVALHNRGLAYRGLEDFDEAMADLQAALELDPQSPSVHHAIGSVHLVRGFFQRAISSYTTVIELDPADAVAHIRRGSAQYAAGFYQDAIEDFGQAITKGEPTVEILGRRAVAYHALGQFEEALADVDQAITLDPEDHRLFSLRAGLKHNLGQPEEAVEDLKKAMDLNRGSGIASEVQGSDFSNPTPVPN